MHETSLVRSLLKQVERVVVEHNAGRVLSVRLSIGEFSGVEPDLIRCAFDDLVQNTSMNGAALIVTRVPLEAQCNSCEHSFHVERFRFECPMCRQKEITIVRGEELLLESVTLEPFAD